MSAFALAASAEVHPTAQISPGAVIDEDARIGANAHIQACAYVGRGVVIGADTVLGPGAVVCDGSEIGARCVIGPGAVVGSRGFGFVLDQGQHREIPQVGKVVIKDDCRIDAGACIDRATTGETRLGAGCKVGSLTQIAHNITLGQNTVIEAQVGMAGSITVGDDCRLGFMAGLAGHLTLGNRVVIEEFAGLTRSKVPDGARMAGYPAREVGE